MGKLHRQDVVLRLLGLTVALTAFWPSAHAQTAAPPTREQPPVQLVQPPGPDQAPADHHDAEGRPRSRAEERCAVHVQPQGDAKSAHEDRPAGAQRAAAHVHATSQYLEYPGERKSPPTEDSSPTTASTSIANGRCSHQDLSPATFMGTGYHRAAAAEAMAKAKAEIARRGLTVTVTKDYYALVVAQRKYATAQQALDRPSTFLKSARTQERTAKPRTATSIKAEIQYRAAGAGLRRSQAGDGERPPGSRRDAVSRR